MNTWTNLDAIKNDKTLVGFLLEANGFEVDCDEFGHWRPIYSQGPSSNMYCVIPKREDAENVSSPFDCENGREVIAELYINDKGVRMARLISEDAKEILGA